MWYIIRKIVFIIVFNIGYESGGYRETLYFRKISDVGAIAPLRQSLGECAGHVTELVR